MAGKQTRSARGEVVDFDILIIKQQLSAAPQAIEVNARREYIDQKDSFRKPRKVEEVAVAPVEAPVVESFDEPVDNDPIPEMVLAAVQQPVEDAQPFLITPEVVAPVESSEGADVKRVGSRKRSG